MTRDDENAVDAVETTVRLPESFVQSLDETIAKSPDSLTASRGDLIRRLIVDGMDRINSDDGVEGDLVDHVLEERGGPSRFRVEVEGARATVGRVDRETSDETLKPSPGESDEIVVDGPLRVSSDGPVSVVVEIVDESDD